MIQQPYFWVSKENENTNQKDICTPMSIAALFKITKIWHPSINGWMDKQHVVYV